LRSRGGRVHDRQRRSGQRDDGPGREGEGRRSDRRRSGRLLGQTHHAHDRHPEPEEISARTRAYFSTVISFRRTSPAEYCSRTIWFFFLSNWICVAPNIRPSPLPSFGSRISISVNG